MDLILFPESDSLKNGYGIAVDYAYDLLSPTDNDIIVWYTNDKEIQKLRKEDIIISRPGLISIKRIWNMISNKLGSEVNYSELKVFKERNFENIHCDDVIFYRAIRRIFPKKKITIRFHNCFARIQDRKNILGIRMNVMFELKLRAYQKLEREIFRDKNTFKIFISEEDKTYYTSMTGRSDASVWPFKIDFEKVEGNRTKICFKNKLVWFGGIQDHKVGSIIWFINEILPKIRVEIPEIEFHLWGTNTSKYHNPSQNIFGYGFYSGEKVPFKETALFINPDIIGGGVKLKLKSYIESGVPFITTPFGFEGYSPELIDGSYCVVADMENWSETIVNLLKN